MGNGSTHTTFGLVNAMLRSGQSLNGRSRMAAAKPVARAACIEGVVVLSRTLMRVCGGRAGTGAEEIETCELCESDGDEWVPRRTCCSQGCRAPCQAPQLSQAGMGEWPTPTEASKQRYAQSSTYIAAKTTVDSANSKSSTPRKSASNHDQARKITTTTTQRQMQISSY